MLPRRRSRRGSNISLSLIVKKFLGQGNKIGQGNKKNMKIFSFHYFY